MTSSLVLYGENASLQMLLLPVLIGPRGNTVLTTSGQPASDTGIDGDYAYDPAARAIYAKTAGAWDAGTPLRGNALLATSGVPGDGAGIDGDFAYDAAAKTMYGPKASGHWPGGASLQGPKGDDGDDGDDGANGRTVLTTAGAPGAGVGADGDFAYDPAAKLMYGPKASGAWPAGVSLQGPAGVNGNTILSVSGAPDNSTGANGDYAFDASTTLLYGPKSGGAWTGGHQLTGATGAQGSPGAYITAPPYASQAAGHAATADGGFFSVVPNNDATIAAYIYQRSGASDTLLATVPNIGAVTAATTRVSALEAQTYISKAEWDQQRRHQDDGLPKAAVLILLGQSNHVQRGSTVQATASANGIMPASGTGIAAFPFSVTNVEFSMCDTDIATFALAAESVGQSVVPGVLSTLLGGRYSRAYVCSVAIGSRTLETLMSGGPRCNMVAALDRLCAKARADGFGPEVVAAAAQGEANMVAGTTEAAYWGYGITYYTMFQLHAAQAMEQPDYRAPIVFFHPYEAKDLQASRDIQRAIARLARDIPNGLDLGGGYNWPVNTDRIHNSDAGMIERGEAEGRMLRRFFENGERFTACYIEDCTLSGTTFVATFNQTVQRDTSDGAGTALNAANQVDGFEWLDNGTYIKILSPLTYAGRKVTGTLNSAPVGTMAQQVLRIASQETTATLTSGIANLSGAQVRGTEGEQWPSIYDPTVVNRRWVAPHYIVPRAP